MGYLAAAFALVDARAPADASALAVGLPVVCALAVRLANVSALAMDPANASALAVRRPNASALAMAPADASALAMSLAGAFPMVRERAPADGALHGAAERPHSREHCDARSAGRH